MEKEIGKREPMPAECRILKRAFQEELQERRQKKFIVEKFQSLMRDYDIQEGFTTVLRTNFETEDLLPLSEVDEVSGFPLLSDILEEALFCGLDYILKDQEESIEKVQQSIAELECCGY